LHLLGDFLDLAGLLARDLIDFRRESRGQGRDVGTALVLGPADTKSLWGDLQGSCGRGRHFRALQLVQAGRSLVARLARFPFTGPKPSSVGDPRKRVSVARSLFSVTRF